MGNCSYLESGETRVLIDAGLSGRQIRKRLESIGRAPERLTGILLTHEHEDHTRGAGILGARLGIPIYCNRDTMEALQERKPVEYARQYFRTGDEFDLGTIGVQSFSVPHDAMDPVGFVLETESGRIGFLTDLGYVNPMILDRIRDTVLLVLEANYDPQLLQEDTRRPWSIKQRIQSRHGHLSNEVAARALVELGSETLKYLYVAHMSRDCNTPEKAGEALMGGLEARHRDRIRLVFTHQDRPTPLLQLP